MSSQGLQRCLLTCAKVMPTPATFTPMLPAGVEKITLPALKSMTILSTATIRFLVVDDILGQEPARDYSLNLDSLGITPLALASLDAPFTEEEVWAVIRALPPD